MSTRTAGLILAGGSARRMGGGDKPLLKLGGEPMIRRIITAIGLPDIAISANGDPGRFAPFGLPVLDDGTFAGQGPLAGVLAGVAWAERLGAEAVLTVPGDTPFVPAGLATALAPAPACAVHEGRVHHLVALWPVTCRNALEDFLRVSGSRRVSQFAADIGMRQMAFTSGDLEPFLNINTPEDLTRARSLAEQSGGRTRG
ncbi:MAG: molybdenum cofactor guanylyltransferase MobA [Acetobacteraceae bacterium]